MSSPSRIVTIAASNRAGSLNRLLLDRTSSALGRVGDVELDAIDLRTFPLPLYDGDLQARDGIPHGAQLIHDRIAEADGVVFAVPEYNGGYPALFKNLIDWVSRIDMFVFAPRYVGLVSATPGRGGGARGLVHTAALFENIFVTTHGEHFTLPAANVELGDEGDALALDGRLDAWAAGFLAGVVEHKAARATA